MAIFDSFTKIAREKLNRGDDFSIFKVEKIEGGFLMEGSEFKLLTRGKNKGKPKWFGQSVKCICTKQELDAFELNYEVTTGNCYECQGSGETMKSWDAVLGKTYKPCRKCNGTGKHIA